MKKQNNGKLRIIPLGGLEQIGMNITAFEYDDSIVVVDCGLAFPEDDRTKIFNIREFPAVFSERSGGTDDCHKDFRQQGRTDCELATVAQGGSGRSAEGGAG